MVAPLNPVYRWNDGRSEMIAVTSAYGAIEIPSGIGDLAAFRRWVHFADLPEKLPVHFLRGEVWADFSRSDPIDNVALRGALTAALHRFEDGPQPGYFFTVYMLWSSDEAGVATVPDCGFFTKQSLKSGRVRLTNGGNPKYQETEIVGPLDMVCELVSDSSEEKDSEWLMESYFAAGVGEYWLIDARDDTVRFDLSTRGKSKFVRRRSRSGWLRSDVFGKSLRLSRGNKRHPFPSFNVEIR
jgi:hypothetical protein